MRDNIGQFVTFVVQIDAAHKYANYKYVSIHPGDTVRRIAARLGHPERAQEIARLNGIRSVTAPLGVSPTGKPVYKDGAFIGYRQPDGSIKSVNLGGVWRNHLKQLRVPGVVASGDNLSVHLDDPRPTITDGYAKFDTVDRPGRKGISRFLGYNPLAYEIAIQFEGYTKGDGAGLRIQDKIATLERLAGRGQHSAAGVGPPPVISLSCTDNTGGTVWVVPANYQRTATNPLAPLWRISNLAWDKTATSDDEGRVIRQKCTVTVTEYTPVTVAMRSASARSKRRKAQQGWQQGLVHGETGLGLIPQTTEGVVTQADAVVG